MSGNSNAKSNVTQTEEELAKLKIRQTISDYRGYTDALIVDALIRPVGKSQESYIEKFIGNYLTAALKDPSSRPAQLVANSVLGDNDFLSRITEWQSKQHIKDVGYQEYLIRKQLYDKQREVFDDTSERLLVINSRRSGKTYLMGRLIVKDLLTRPDSHVVYINRTSTAAIRQIRGPFMDALSTTSLRIVKGSVENQELYLSNGGQLLVLGNNNARDLDKLRGERISLCILDECGHQANTRQLIREVIYPALMDYNGQLVLVGTPPRIPKTYIEECWNNPSWKKFHWTWQDNPAIPNKDTVIQKVCQEHGVTEDSAFIQREYFGRLDAYDDDAKWIKKATVIDAVPTDVTYDYCWIGVDWGYEDKGAIIAALADKTHKTLYVVDSWSEAHCGAAEKAQVIREMIERVQKKWHISREPIVICDTNNKEAMNDLYYVYNISNVFGAYKYDKDMGMDQLNDFFATDRIQLLKGATDCIEEDIQNSVWKRDEETDKILHKIDDDVWHPNALMALLYVSRQYAFDIMNYTDSNKAAKQLIEEVEG